MPGYGGVVFAGDPGINPQTMAVVMITSQKINACLLDGIQEKMLMPYSIVAR